MAVLMPPFRRVQSPVQEDRCTGRLGQRGHYKALSRPPPRRPDMAPAGPTFCPLPPVHQWSGILFDSCFRCLSLRSSPPGDRVEEVSERPRLDQGEGPAMAGPQASGQILPRPSA